MNDVTPEERQKKAFKRWYERHKKSFNAKRKERYRKDPEYRNKVIQTVRKARERVRAVDEPKIRVREYKGKEVPVFSITDVAVKIERSPDTIRAWEKRGLIPKPVFPGSIRLYTKAQILLLRWLVGEVDKAPSKVAQKEVLEACRDELFNAWEKV